MHSSGKEQSANAGDIRDMGPIPGSGRSPEGGHVNPLQYSCLMLGRNGFRGSSKLSVLTHQLEIVQEEPYICSKAVVPADGAATQNVS